MKQLQKKYETKLAMNKVIEVIEKPLLSRLKMFVGKKIKLKSGSFPKSFDYVSLINDLSERANKALSEEPRL